MSRIPEGYSHPHTAPQWIPMGNHIMEHRQFCVNIVPPILLKATIVETQKQHVGIRVTQSFGACITTTGVETIVASNIDVVRRGELIRSATKLGNRLSGILAIKNLSRSSTLPTTTTRVIGIPQMVFTNPITITHVNRTTD
jgi:hypothetical protein